MAGAEGSVGQTATRQSPSVFSPPPSLQLRRGGCPHPPARRNDTQVVPYDSLSLWERWHGVAVTERANEISNSPLSQPIGCQLSLAAKRPPFCLLRRHFPPPSGGNLPSRREPNSLPTSLYSVGEGLCALPFLGVRPYRRTPPFVHFSFLIERTPLVGRFLFSCAVLPFRSVNIWRKCQNIQKFGKKFVTKYTKTACNFKKTLLQCKSINVM